MGDGELGAITARQCRGAWTKSIFHSILGIAMLYCVINKLRCILDSRPKLPLVFTKRQSGTYTHVYIEIRYLLLLQLLVFHGQPLSGDALS